jgi:hypothetical protein
MAKPTGRMVYHTERGYRFPLNGYRYDLEQSRLLQRNSTDISRLLRSPIEAPRNFRYDPVSLRDMDPRQDVQVEDQGQQGACAGFAGTSCVEFTYWIETKKKVQLSNAFLYYAAQKEDGINGDQGSTINGCAKVVRTYGVPPEKSWPYPSRYDNRPPNGDWEAQRRAAAQFRIGSHTFLTDPRETVQYLRKGIGGVQIGVSWGGEVDSSGEFHWQPGGGGHSVALLGWEETAKDMYVWLLNSWGRRWGLNGWARVSIRTLQKMLQHQHTVFVGYSDMDSPDHVRDIPVDFNREPAFV